MAERVLADEGLARRVQAMLDRDDREEKAASAGLLGGGSAHAEDEDGFPTPVGLPALKEASRLGSAREPRAGRDKPKGPGAQPGRAENDRRGAQPRRAVGRSEHLEKQISRDFRLAYERVSKLTGDRNFASWVNMMQLIVDEGEDQGVREAELQQAILHSCSEEGQTLVLERRQSCRLQGSPFGHAEMMRLIEDHYSPQRIIVEEILSEAIAIAQAPRESIMDFAMLMRARVHRDFLPRFPDFDADYLDERMGRALLSGFLNKMISNSISQRAGRESGYKAYVKLIALSPFRDAKVRQPVGSDRPSHRDGGDRQPPRDGPRETCRQYLDGVCRFSRPGMPTCKNAHPPGLEGSRRTAPAQTGAVGVKLPGMAEPPQGGPAENDDESGSQSESEAESWFATESDSEAESESESSSVLE